jgi:hypothetical protein
MSAWGVLTLTKHALLDSFVQDAEEWRPQCALLADTAISRVKRASWKHAQVNVPLGNSAFQESQVNKRHVFRARVDSFALETGQRLPAHLVHLATCRIKALQCLHAPEDAHPENMVLPPGKQRKRARVCLALEEHLAMGRGGASLEDANRNVRVENLVLV